MYGVSLAFAVIGLLQLFAGFGLMRVPIPGRALLRQHSRARRRSFANGTIALLTGFLLMNLLVLLEVADRLSLKRDLEVAREIQNAMLPEGTWSGPGVEAFGLTKPPTPVGGDFYDILPQPDGTVLVALGDVAGKASPAAAA
jgi:serine phosphatase RsbU (regulator of sigma subunit)